MDYTIRTFLTTDEHGWGKTEDETQGRKERKEGAEKTSQRLDAKPMTGRVLYSVGDRMNRIFRIHQGVIRRWRRLRQIRNGRNAEAQRTRRGAEKMLWCPYLPLWTL
jgi:hypothetical protein